jgi:hypothetical protein
MAVISGCSAVFATRLANHHLLTEKAQLLSAKSTLLTRSATLQKQTAALADGSLLVQQKQDLGEVERQISQLELTVIPLATLQSRSRILRDELKKIDEEFSPYLHICFRRSPQDLDSELQAIKTAITKVDARIAELKARQ